MNIFLFRHVFQFVYCVCVILHVSLFRFFILCVLCFQVSKYLKQQGLDPNDYNFEKTVQNFFDTYDKNDDKVLTLDEFASTHDEL